MKIDYQFSAGASNSDLATADETRLRYDAFLGDLIIRGEGVDLSARWGWVPVLDFAVCLLAAVRRLQRGDGEAVFEFTESDDLIKFRRVADEVRISSTYSSESISCPLQAFVESAVQFCATLAEELQADYPTLRDNKFFAQFLNEVAALKSRSRA